MPSTAEHLRHMHYRNTDHQALQFDHAISAAGNLSGKSLLDIGCGSGDLIPRLPTDCQYLGTEVNQTSLDLARDEHHGHHFIQTAGVPGPADVIVAIGVLQSASDPVKLAEQMYEHSRELLILTIWQYAECVGEIRNWAAEYAPEVTPPGDGLHDFFTVTITK